MNPTGIKLNDEQVRRFICDGVIVLDSGLPPEVHQDIYDKLHWKQHAGIQHGQQRVAPRCRVAAGPG